MQEKHTTSPACARAEIKQQARRMARKAAKSWGVHPFHQDNIAALVLESKAEALRALGDGEDTDEAAERYRRAAAEVRRGE